MKEAQLRSGVVVGLVALIVFGAFLDSLDESSDLLRRELDDLLR